MLKGIDFEASDGAHNLKLGTGALCALEESYDASFGELAVRLKERPSITLLRSFLAAGTTREGKVVELDRAGQLLEELGMERSAELVGKALEEYFAPRAGKPKLK